MCFCANNDTLTAILRDLLFLIKCVIRNMRNHLFYMIRHSML